jgi:AcrR family transcriptional regulator
LTVQDHPAAGAAPLSADSFPTGQRSLRADARLNRDRLLEAAARAFARDGTEASLKAIAQDAGVGIGTLYRHFPTREQLVEATYRSEVARTREAVPELLGSLPPAEALRAWMDRFVGFLATKHGMADALRAILATEDGLRLETRQLLTDALAELLAAGVKDRTLRSDVDPTDVLMGLGGVALIAGQPDQRDQARRLLDLLLDGLRYGSDRQ